jgi:hypothetical protein
MEPGRRRDEDRSIGQSALASLRRRSSRFGCEGRKAAADTGEPAQQNFKMKLDAIASSIALIAFSNASCIEL